MKTQKVFWRSTSKNQKKTKKLLPKYFFYIKILKGKKFLKVKNLKIKRKV
jgi:hypothetical protein